MTNVDSAVAGTKLIASSPFDIFSETPFKVKTHTL